MQPGERFLAVLGDNHFALQTVAVNELDLRQLNRHIVIIYQQQRGDLLFAIFMARRLWRG